jgi:hypothetical protein
MVDGTVKAAGEWPEHGLMAGIDWNCDLFLQVCDDEDGWGARQV